MNEILTELFAELDEVRQDVKAALVAASAGAAERRPSSGVWSPAEVAHHLSKTEQGIALALARRIARARAAGSVAEATAPQRSTRLEGAGIERRDVRRTAPSSLEPTEGISVADVLAALDRSRQSLRDAIASAGDVDLASVRFPHPALGELDAYEWLDFIARHERRHLYQIGEVLERQ
jgi:hypothetical protein